MNMPILSDEMKACNKAVRLVFYDENWLEVKKLTTVCNLDMANLIARTFIAEQSGVPIQYPGSADELIVPYVTRRAMRQTCFLSIEILDPLAIDSSKGSAS